MVLIRIVVFAGLLSAVGTLSQAQQVGDLFQTPVVLDRTWSLTSTLDQVPGYYQTLGLRRYLNSFTSYQFPNPFPPGQDPLSRLEFPIDQWFVQFSAGYDAVSWSLDCAAWFNITRESGLMMQDSDWDDEVRPFQKTIFSESRCRLNWGRLLDVRLALGNLGGALFRARPVVGYRRQDFRFTTHDGYQLDVNGIFTDLPGDGIEFTQIFSHYYCGASADLRIPLRAVFEQLPTVPVRVQIDYAAVTAVNEDLHLLRRGDRITTENTRGHCWHVGLTSGVRIRNVLSAHIEADFKRIITHGNHRLTNSLFGIDFSFDGSRVWSDQASVTLVGEIVF